MSEHAELPLNVADHDALNPHSDLPAAGSISIEITDPSGERSGVSPPSAVTTTETPTEKPLPFGVYFGTESR